MADQSQQQPAPADTGGSSDSAGGAPPASAGADASDGRQSAKEIEDLRSQVEDLTKKFDSVKAERDQYRKEKSKLESGTKTAEERIADLEVRYQEAADRAAKAERQTRSKTAVDQILETVPTAKQKLARAVVVGMGAELDFGAEDNAAAIEAASERLKKEFPELLAKEAPRQQHAIPVLSGAPNGKQVQVEHLGMTDDRGQRLV